MTITSENKRNQYTITEAQVVFPYTFRILAQGNLLVIHTTAVGVETELELTTNYTVSGVGDAGGGNVTTCGDASPYPTDDTITIIRDVPLTQLTDYVEHDTFPAESHEDALDKLIMIVQKFAERLDRALFLLKSSTYSNLTLPDPVAQKLLQWKDDLSGLINVSPYSEGDLSVTDYIKTLLDDEDSATARATLEIDAAIQATKLDDLTTPDDNTDLNASTTKHGLMPKLDNNVIHFFNGQGGQTVPTGIKMAGDIVQIVSYQTGALATGTTLLPFDDTIPQKTEGDEYMTLAITPTVSTNKLKIEVVWNGSSAAGANQRIIVALFQDDIDNALAASVMSHPALGHMLNYSFIYYMTAGTESETTFKIRAGDDAGSTTTFNGQTGARRFGGALISSIVITEIQA